MSLPVAFLDELRTRTVLSSLVGRSLKLTKAGREYKACCPFHSEKTPSFYVNDEKGFYHCFGCQAHGDAIRWLTDVRGLAFMDAVKELAADVGLEVPAPSPEAAARAERIEGIRPALEAAQALFRRELEANGPAREYLLARGLDDATIERFGLGWAPTRNDYVRELGVDFHTALAAGLVWQVKEEGQPRKWGETFRGRITIPVHDPRGRLVGFAGRILQPSGTAPKYKNSPDTEIFDKGRTLFNLHRAAEAARAAKRLIVVEGQLDAVALDLVGIAEAVAPMGTALTADHLERLWRMTRCPMLAFDGDDAGRRAAVRACTAALPDVAPARSLTVALFPPGQDPDDLARAGGRDAIEAVLMEAVPIGRLLFDAIAAERSDDDPESVAGVWNRLDELARSIADEETRAQYLAAWRSRFEREVSLAPAPDLPALHALIEAEDNALRKPADRYAWPEPQDDSERRLILIVQRGLELREQRREIGESIKDLLAMAKAVGFSTKAINAVFRDIEADADAREEGEALWALYRRVLGIRGPMNEAAMPSATDARAAQVSTASQRRLSKAMVMIEARALPAPEATDG